jgi:hypothetical protein
MNIKGNTSSGSGDNSDLSKNLNKNIKEDKETKQLPKEDNSSKGNVLLIYFHRLSHNVNF